MCRYPCRHKFSTLLVKTKEHGCQIILQEYVSFSNKLSNCFPNCISTSLENSLYFHQEQMKVTVVSHPHSYLGKSMFWTLAILIGMQWYFLFICIFLTIYHVKHLFIHLFSICICLLMKSLLRYLIHFLKSGCLFPYC